ncbi:RDD family protein [Streptomyces sp. NPDC004435]|uniref:RDD family protein n=1 Tax=Streptomyces sp. NPDC004435 TaxID=3364701 RepID=UPI0036C24683
MSTDQPPPGPPPDDDPFSKRPQDPPPGSPPPGSPPPGSPPPGSPPPGSPYDSPYPPPPPYGGYGGGYGGTDPLSGMPPLAETGRRILARLVDWVIVAVPLAIIGIPFDIYDRATRDDTDFQDAVTGGSSLVFQLLTIVAYVAYDTVLTAQNGQTLGKRLMKLRVAMLNDGSTPPMSQSLLRAVVLWLPALVCCACLWPLLILILILVDKPYKQGLHDKAAKTVVVTAAR